MQLNSGQRRELAAKGNRLKASIIVRADDLSDSAVEHVRKAFGDKLLMEGLSFTLPAGGIAGIGV